MALAHALHLASQAAGGTSRVALPAFSCFDMASAAVRAGHPVSFYDIDPCTLGPDPESLAAVLRQGANVVVVANLYGIPIDWDTLEPLMAAHGAVVIEDAAQGHGTRSRLGWAGSRGRFGVLSFGRGKGWTGGAGGAVLLRDPDDLPLSRQFGLAGNDSSGVKVFAQAAAHFVLGRPGLYGLPRAIPGLGLGETHFHAVDTPGTMSPVAAALLLDSFGTADASVDARRSVAEDYSEALAARGLTPGHRIPSDSSPGYIRYPIRIPDGMAAFADGRRAYRLGAAASYPTPLPELSQMSPLTSRPTGSFPGARDLVRDLVTLPTHARTTVLERRELIGLLDQAQRGPGT